MSRQTKNRQLQSTDSKSLFQKVQNMISFTWNYFKRNIVDQNQVQCTQCNQIIKINSGSTSQMVNHLRYKHNIESNKNLKANRQVSPRKFEDKNKKENYQNISSPDYGKLRDNLFDYEEEEQKINSHDSQQNLNDKIEQKSLKDKIENNLIFPVSNSSFDSKNQDMRFQNDPIMRPKRIKIIEPRKGKKLRGPRGPYKKREQTQHWQNILKNSHDNFKGIQTQVHHQTPSRSDLSPSILQSHNQLVIVDKNTKQIRIQIRNFLQKLPYHLKINEINMKLLDRYSFAPGLCNHMIKKYHWVTLSDFKCLKKLKLFYPHVVILRVYPVRKSRQNQNEEQNKNIQKKNKKKEKRQKQDKSQSSQLQKENIYQEEEEDEEEESSQSDSQISDSQQLDQKKEVIEDKIQQNLEDKQQLKQNQELPNWDIQPSESEPVNLRMIQEPLQNENDEEDMIFICTQEMRNNYAKFGQIVRMTKFYDLIHSRCQGTVSIYFTGQDQDTKPVIFGLLILKTQTHQSWRKGMEFFLSSMGGNQMPQVFIREVNSGAKDMIQKAAQYFSKQIGRPIRVISHYNYKQITELIQKVKKAIRNNNQKFQKQIMRKLFNLLNETSSEKKTALLKKLKKYLNKRHQQNQVQSKLNKRLDQIIKGSHLNIPSWVGYNLQIKRFLKLVQLLRPALLYRENLAKIFMILFHTQHRLSMENNQVGIHRTFNKKIQFYENLFKNNEADYQIFDQNQELFELRNYLQPLIFAKIVASYIGAVRHLSAVKSDSTSTYKLFYNERNHFKFEQDWHEKKSNTIPVYTVQYSVIDDCWHCNCKLQFWTGLPCCHIIKVLTINGGSLFYYIHDNWLVDNDIDQSNEDQMEKEQNQDFNAIMEAGSQVVYDGDYKLLSNENQFYERIWSDLI